jgi:hypothetical protein
MGAALDVLRGPQNTTPLTPRDANVYLAYVRAEERIRDQGGRVTRVAPDYEPPQRGS